MHNLFENEVIVKKNKIRLLTDMRVSKRVYEEISVLVYDIIKRAESRAKQSGRQTILKRDL